MLSHPFKADIYPDGLPPSEGASLLHANELDELLTLLEWHTQKPADKAQEGTVVLLKAARAGYGKSHLLAVLEQKLSGTAAILTPIFDPDQDFRWTPLFWNCLSKAHQTPIVPGQPLTVLDQLARQLFGLLNAELIREKRVPCSNPEAAISALQERSLELFDLNDPRQAVGKWFAEHFERLLPVTSNVLATFSHIRQDAAMVWLRALCAYTQGVPDGDLLRFEHLRWAIQQGNGGGVMAGGMNILSAPTLDESFFKDRLVELLRLTSMVRPLLLIFDHLDAVHGQPQQTMRVASVVAEFRRLLPRSVSILSVNQDLWAGSFQKFLPSALEDRLSDELIHLKEINAEQGKTLLQSRLRLAGINESESQQFLNAIQLPHWFAREPGRFAAPRGLLRHAARAWEEWTKRRPATTPPAEMPAVASPPQEADPLPTFQNTLPLGGAGTSFQQLKVMLEKLRLERIAGGKTGSPPADSGTILRDSTGPAVPSAESFIKAPEPVKPLVPASTSESVVEQFHQLRQRLLGAKPLRVDQDLLCHLLGVGGKRIAVVKASHISVPGSTGPGAMLWQTPDGEILFGTESHQDRAYWQALLAHTRQRYASGPPRTHLAIFSASQEPVDLQWWLAAEDAGAALDRYVDVISLDPDALATLYAADELLHAAEHAEAATISPDEVFSAVSTALEPFWKRITRMLR